jgi:carbonic anhydrase
VHKLIRGIVDFHNRVLPEYKERFKSLADAQHPDELFVACSDSRVVVDLFSESEPGDLFELRNIGNIIPPATKEGDAIAACSAGAVVEYAVAILEVADVVVLGHSECGAMKALSGKAHAPESARNLHDWLRYGREALARLERDGPLDPSLAFHNQLSQVNVLQQLDNVRTHECCARAIAEGKLQLHGWWFDVVTADVYAYDEGARRFLRIDDQSAERMLARIGERQPQ